MVKYSDYYVAFLDVLGFSDQVSRAKSKKELGEISNYYNQVNRLFDTFSAISQKRDIFGRN